MHSAAAAASRRSVIAASCRGSPSEAPRAVRPWTYRYLVLMEAVHKLQFPDQSVELRGESVVIDNLVVADHTLVELVERRLEREITALETVTGALEIGARVL